jgi:hypothetical protein
VIAGFYISPWAWLASLGILLAGAVHQFGLFPSGANSDPTWVAGFTPVYEAAYMLLVPALLSPAVVMGDLAWRLARRGGNARGRALPLAAYILGCGLAGAIIFGDAFGLMNWLLD